MSESITIERQRELITGLQRLEIERASGEADLREREGSARALAKSERDEQQAVAKADFERQRELLVAEEKSAKEAIYCQYETDGFALFQEERRFAERAYRRYREAQENAKILCRHESQQIQVKYKQQSLTPKAEFARFKQQCEQRAAETQSLEAETQKIVSRRCAWPADAPPPLIPPVGLTSQQYVERFSAAVAQAVERRQALQNQKAARFVDDGWPLLIFCLAVPILGYPFWLLLNSFGLVWAVGACVLTAIALGVIARQVALPLARRQMARIVPQFQEAVSIAGAELAAALSAAHAESHQKYLALREQRDRDLANAKREWKKTKRNLKAEHGTHKEETIEHFAARRRALEEPFERQFQRLEKSYPPRLASHLEEFEKKLADIDAACEAKTAGERGRVEQERAALNERWTTGLAEFEEAVGAMNRYCGEKFLPWSQLDAALQSAGKQTAKQNGAIPALGFGRYEFRLRSAEAEDFQLPAILSYPDRPSLLLEAEGAGREAATDVIQSVMLRLLTTFPPGKVRFTIIDPVGLGENFSAFMHLADFDERLVSSRIWTESAHINQRLADLTQHMEDVIQKYLRNEFASIQEYNAQAGEVAEPLQILVVANFPASFSDEAARRLVSIATSGARCGVYTLISVDTKQKLPRNLDLTDLETQAATLVWDAAEKRFCWQDAELRDLPLTLEAPPDDDRFTAIIRAVGRQAKETARVEVPFESVLPATSQWWTADSRVQIEVPLGRAGAKKLQALRLGTGTSQHVLIAGKTGSGKSTLLNALITNLAAHYSPDELHFYLIDFKKGVEFKAYATFQLPHARVIAIESEREFGMSVLQRLDEELKRRGDLFRQQGVQDLPGYRNSNGQATMPRILLVIDEFQEFFTSDDKISHDASLLLDRLVRQGRAFGIHVLLGSQTLAGAYSLARSTIGQMAVRIALQCSESDAHLILSEDNTAARLLNRPGEAIYNDANGLIEGNHPFQVVWLPDHQREAYLRRLAEMAAERGVSLPPPTVFEGNVAADPATNEQLRELIEAQSPCAASAAPRAWLGSAVAIKEPTSAMFRRQVGSNLLIVGQQEELAAGMLGICHVALAAQVRGCAESLSSLVVLDGAVSDTAAAGCWSKIIALNGLGARVVGVRDAAAVVREISAEVERRVAAGEQAFSSVFLLVHNLSRFRDLKKSDDFGLSFDERPSTAVDKQFAAILRDGPAVGVHTLVWCDSFANVSRWLDRQTLRDFDMRVLMQMSASDSSQLMDSPGASRLGSHLAYYYSEEQGRAEKFRPYGLPSQEWLACVGERFAGDPTKARTAAVCSSPK